MEDGGGGEADSLFLAAWAVGFGAIVVCVQAAVWNGKEVLMLAALGNPQFLLFEKVKGNTRITT